MLHSTSLRQEGQYEIPLLDVRLPGAVGAGPHLPEPLLGRLVAHDPLVARRHHPHGHDD